MDLPCAPILADMTVDGRLVKIAGAADEAVVALRARPRDRQADLADRRAAGAAGDVPGEKTSPTQPFVDQAAGLRSAGRDGRRPDRLHARSCTPKPSSWRRASARPAVHAAGRQQVGRTGGHADAAQRDRRRQLARRFARPGDATSSTSTRTPWSAPWRSAAGAQRSDMAYVVGARRRSADNPRGGAGRPPMSRGCRSSSRRTAGSPPSTWPRARSVWQIAHGETPDKVRNHPALKGLTIPRTGRPGRVGTLVTKTLLIAGEAGFFTLPDGRRGAMLRAYDKATGNGARRGLHAGAADRLTDDLHEEWQAVRGRRRQRSGISW